MENKLFSGKPEIGGGLSNEQELVKICPKNFKKEWHHNKWCDAAMTIFFSGGKIGHWKWRSQDEEEKKHQLLCFRSLISGWGLPHEDKTAVAGWMLSEMLIEIPTHIPA